MSSVSDDEFQGSSDENRGRINKKNNGTPVGSAKKKEEKD